MSLRARLAALKEESGAASVSSPGMAPAVDPVDASKSDVTPAVRELERQLQVRRTAGATSAATAPAGDSAALARLVGGTLVADGLVEIVTTHALPHRYGEGDIDAAANADAAFLLNAHAAREPRRLVVLDTETTGLAGGTGTLPFLTGIAICEARQLTIFQWLLTRFCGETPMLGRLQALLRPADLLSSYNGKCFDVPLLLTRASLARQRSVLEGMEHLDLLYPVRRAFKGRWPDCRLQTAEQRLLAHRRVGDIPGEAIPEVWFDWMRSGNTAGMASVVQHNRDDLVGLTALVSAVARVFEQPERHDARMLPVLAHSAADDAQLRRRLQASLERLEITEVFEMARLARRQGDWDTAVIHWKALAHRGYLPAVEQLAKYHEHQRRDIETALSLTRTLITEAGAQPHHLHRERRLLVKLSSAEGNSCDGDNCYDARDAPVAQQDRATAS